MVLGYRGIFREVGCAQRRVGRAGDFGCLPYGSCFCWYICFLGISGLYESLACIDKCRAVYC